MGLTATGVTTVLRSRYGHRCDSSPLVTRCEQDNPTRWCTPCLLARLALMLDRAGIDVDEEKP